MRMIIHALHDSLSRWQHGLPQAAICADVEEGAIDCSGGQGKAAQPVATNGATEVIYIDGVACLLAMILQCIYVHPVACALDDPNMLCSSTAATCTATVNEYEICCCLSAHS